LKRIDSELLHSRISFILPGCNAEDSFKRFAEGGVGIVADGLSEQLLQTLAPFGIEAALAAIDSLQGANDERIQQKALALEHARYEVTRARRQYDAVDPANRLVAAELERRWNQALTTEAQLEAELVALQDGRERPLADTQKRDLLTFARDLPKLWDDPQSLQDRRRLHATRRSGSSGGG
jgi:hypothetical protein